MIYCLFCCPCCEWGWEAAIHTILYFTDYFLSVEVDDEVAFIFASQRSTKRLTLCFDLPRFEELDEEVLMVCSFSARCACQFDFSLQLKQTKKVLLLFTFVKYLLCVLHTSHFFIELLAYNLKLRSNLKA